jgi:hypothetical protein
LRGNTESLTIAVWLPSRTDLLGFWSPQGYIKEVLMRHFCERQQ